MRTLVVCSILLAASVAEAQPRRAVTCKVTVDTAKSQLAIDGKVLPDLERATIESVLGKPDRVESITTRQRFERWGIGGAPPSSTMVTITDLHYVYDRRGLVFPTRRKSSYDNRETADRVLLFFANARSFDNLTPPAVLPKQRGSCTLAINGTAIDPTVDLRPSTITYQTQEFTLFGMKFGPTSYTTVIDSFYSIGSDRYVRLMLDAPKTGRASYAELR